MKRTVACLGGVKFHWKISLSLRNFPFFFPFHQSQMLINHRNKLFDYQYQVDTNKRWWNHSANILQSHRIVQQSRTIPFKNRQFIHKSIKSPWKMMKIQKFLKINPSEIHQDPWKMPNDPFKMLPKESRKNPERIPKECRKNAERMR